MIPRLLPLSVALVLASAALSGCTPQPAPTPTPTGFATEDEAFAAAEETYRAYVDALNQSRKDSAHQPTPSSFLSGQALEVDQETQRQLADSGLSIQGLTRVLEVEQISATLEPGGTKAILAVCLDSSNARVVNASGDDVTPTDRDEIYALNVVFSERTGSLLIASSELNEDAKC